MYTDVQSYRSETKLIETIKCEVLDAHKCNYKVYAARKDEKSSVIICDRMIQRDANTLFACTFDDKLVYEAWLLE